MTGKSHMKIALGIALWTVNPDVIVGAVIGSLLPDIDTKNSKLGKYNLFIRLKCVKKHVKHRGVTHSLIGLMSFMFISSVLFDIVSTTGLFIGIVSHLVADMATVGGIQLLWPKRSKIRFACLKTDGWLEWIISTSILLTGILLLVRCAVNV